MAINKKGINITSGFKLISPTPIDVRFVVEDEDELQSIIDNQAAYEGLEVWVKSLGRKKQFNGNEFVEIQASGGSGSITIEQVGTKEEYQNFFEEKLVSVEEGRTLDLNYITLIYNYISPTTIYRCFVNTNLTKEEIISILDKLEIDEYTPYYVWKFVSQDNCYLSISKNSNNVYEIFYNDGNSFDGSVIWNSITGFDEKIKSKEFTYLSIRSYNYYDMFVENSGTKNEILKDLFSNIPFYKVEQNFTRVFNPIPNNEEIQNFYIDYKAKEINVIREQISKLTFSDINDSVQNILNNTDIVIPKIYIIYSDANGENMLYITYDCLDSNSGIPSYKIVRKVGSANYIQYLYDVLCEEYRDTNVFGGTIQAVSEVNLGGTVLPVGQENNKLSIFSTTPFKYELKEVWLSTPVPNSGFIEKIYFNYNYDLYKALEVFSKIQFTTNADLFQLPFYVVYANDDLSRVVLLYNGGEYDGIQTYGLSVFNFATGEGLYDIYNSLNGTPIWEDDLKDLGYLELNQAAISEAMEISIGDQNDLLTDLISITPFDISHDYSEKKSIQLYSTEDGNIKKVFPRVRIEDLRTSLNGKYNVSNITYGEQEIIGLKEEYSKGSLYINNYTQNEMLIYFNYKLSKEQTINILKEAKFDFYGSGNGSGSESGSESGSGSGNYGDSSGSGGDSTGSSSGSSSGFSTILEAVTKSIYDEENDYYYYLNIKINVIKISEEYFIERQIIKFNDYGEELNNDAVVIFSSNSAYCDFEGWNLQYPDYLQTGFTYQDIDYLNFVQEKEQYIFKIISLYPFYKEIKNGVIDTKKGVFEKKYDGTPNYDKPISIHYDISNKIPLNNKVLGNQILFNESLSKERIIEILSKYWENRWKNGDFEKPDGRYDIKVSQSVFYVDKHSIQLEYYFGGKMLINIYTSNWNNYTIFECYENGTVYIYNPQIFNSNMTFDNFDPDLVELDENIEELSELFYMVLNKNNLTLNLDDSIPIEKGKGISEIKYKGVVYSFADENAITYEEVD